MSSVECRTTHRRTTLREEQTLKLGAMAKELELGGLAPVVKENGEQLEEFAREYARVAAALTALRNA